MRYGELKVWSEEWDGVPVIGAEGEVDLGTVDQLRAVASEVVRSKPESMIFDLRKVSYMDSSGLGILVAARKQLRNDPEAVVVITDQPAVIQSLHITGLDRVLRVLREPEGVKPSVKS
jgi:anti-sigma B factor antagonist